MFPVLLLFLLLSNCIIYCLTHHQVSNYKHHHEDNQTHSLTWDFHAVPHGLNPFPTKDSEDDEECMEEVIHVPPRELTVFWNATHTVFVVLSKELHPDHSKDEDDDRQNQSQVPQSTHRVSNYLNQHVECWPWLGQLKHTHLKETEKIQIKNAPHVKGKTTIAKEILISTKISSKTCKHQF